MLGRTAKRVDAVVDSTPTEGNLVRVQTPKFISLVGLPANQVAFKVLRNDTGESKMTNPLLRRARRSDSSPVLRLTFPSGVDETAASALLTTYGLSGYTLEQSGEVLTATRADLKSISPEKTMQIKLSDDGLFATVARQDAGLEAPGDKQAITVASFEFDSEKFTSDTIKAWLTDKSVDGELKEQQNPTDSYVVRRSEIQDGEETRRMTIEDGVTAVVIRSDISNVPDGFIAVVSEAAYGGWGWGQLDFTAMMADVEFGDQMREAISTLESVLREIILWSSLPVEVRKELALRATSQFGEYVTTVMDSLPRQLLVSVVRSANHKMESKMTTAQNGGTGTDSKAVAEATPITRAEVDILVSKAVADALQARADAETAEATQRADEKAAADAAALAAAAAIVDAPLTRADLKAIVDEAVKPLNEAVEQLKGVTVLRSAGEQNHELGKGMKQETTTDVFRGALPGLRAADKK